MVSRASSSGFLTIPLPFGILLHFHQDICDFSFWRIRLFLLPEPDDIKTQDQTQDGDEKEKGQAEDDIVFKKRGYAQIACRKLQAHNYRNYQAQNSRILKQSNLSAPRLLFELRSIRKAWKNQYARTRALTKNLRCGISHSE
jgi:hypothetical protein